MTRLVGRGSRHGSDTLTYGPGMDQIISAGHQGPSHGGPCPFLQCQGAGLEMSPLHRENRENGPPKNLPYQGKYREFGDFAKTEGIIFAQVVGHKYRDVLRLVNGYNVTITEVSKKTTFPSWERRIGSIWLLDMVFTNFCYAVLVRRYSTIRR